MFEVKSSTAVTLESGDPGFTFVDGVTLYTRAGIRINQSCPKNVQDMIMVAFERGWIDLVAYMPRDQWAWYMLSNGEKIDA